MGKKRLTGENGGRAKGDLGNRSRSASGLSDGGLAGAERSWATQVVSAGSEITMVKVND